MRGLDSWAEENLSEVIKAREAFEAREKGNGR
jgi:hypothetical protein